MERSIWRQTLSKKTCQRWKCPTCRSGTAIFDPSSLRFSETTASKNQRTSSEDWNPYDIDLSFTARAACNNPKCKEGFSIAGDGGLEESGGFDTYEMEEYFRPLFIHPMPDIIELPAKCPREIAEPIRESFKLFRLQGEACAGRIRVALELLLTHLGIPTSATNSKGKEHELSLHARIDLYSEADPILGGHLMALKWLGNTGSHGGERLYVPELLDAYEVRRLRSFRILPYGKS